MSRYGIPGYDPQHVIIVGFDPPLESFFLTVDDLSQPDVEQQQVAWQGTQPHELPHVEALANALQPYAVLSPETRQRLQQDYDGREPPTPLQRHMLRILARVRKMP